MVTKDTSQVAEISESSCSRGGCDTPCFTLTHILLIIIIVLNALGIYFLTGNSLSISGLSIDSFGIKQALLEVEYDKSGGKGNYELLTRAQQLSLQDPQNPSNIKAMKQYVESFDANGIKQQVPGNGAKADNGDTTPISGDKISDIISSSSIQGNKDANILVVEYSDMECPFCIKQYQDTKLWNRLQTQYGDKVKFAFKNNRGVNHAGTEAKALGTICAKKVGGDEAYIKFYTAIMDGSTQSLGVFDVAKLPEVAKGLSLDIKKWEDCTKSQEAQDIFDKETNEAKEFGLGGTPGTLILNVTTGEYSTIEGAYPFTSFTQKIDALLK